MTLTQAPRTVPQVLLFDWHATLVDTHDAMYYAVDEVLPRLEALGLADRLVSVEDSRTVEDARLVQYVRTHGRLHPKVRKIRKISRTDIFDVLFGEDQEALTRAHQAFDDAYRSQKVAVTPMEPDLLKTLEHLRDTEVLMGLLSNRDREFVDRELETLGVGWRECFDVLVCGTDAHRRKPHPDQIQAALEQLGEPVDGHCWYIGDSTTDVAAACRAGVASVFYNGANWDQAWLDRIFPGTVRYPYQPHAVVDNFHELLHQVRLLRFGVVE